MAFAVVIWKADRVDIGPRRGYIVRFENARVAQRIEQRFPKPLVGGSIPLPGTNFI